MLAIRYNITKYIFISSIFDIHFYKSDNNLSNHSAFNTSRFTIRCKIAMPMFFFN